MDRKTSLRLKLSKWKDRTRQKIELEIKIKNLEKEKKRRENRKNRQVKEIERNNLVPMVIPSLGVYLFIGPPGTGYQRYR